MLFSSPVGKVFAWKARGPGCGSRLCHILFPTIRNKNQIMIRCSNECFKAQYVSAMSFIFIDRKNADIFLFNFTKEYFILRAKFH